MSEVQDEQQEEQQNEELSPEQKEQQVIEGRARKMGWRPKEEFKGAPEVWTDAETFVKNGEESLPLIRARNKKLEEENDRLSRSVAEVREMNDKVFKNAYTQAKKDFEAQARQAAKDGDEDAAVEAATGLAQIEAEKATRDAAPKVDPVFQSWESENEWHKDPKLRAKAVGIAAELRAEGDTTFGRAFLDKIASEFKVRNPDVFENPRRKAEGGVERPNSGGEGAPGKKTGWDALPKEAKEAGERFIRDKVFQDDPKDTQNGKTAKQKYAEMYNSQ